MAGEVEFSPLLPLVPDAFVPEDTTAEEIVLLVRCILLVLQRHSCLSLLESVLHMTKKLIRTMTTAGDAPVRLLIINPNTSQHMTDALKPAAESLGYSNVSLQSPSLFHKTIERGR